MLNITFTIFRTGAVPGAPGARRGPRRADNRPKKQSRIYREVSVNRNTATETQTLKWGREGRKIRRKHKENDPNKSENRQKLRDPAPTLRVSVSRPSPRASGEDRGPK